MSPTSLKLSDFDFDLPPEAIARYPLAERSASRLLVLKQGQTPCHHHFSEMLSYVEAGDLLVFNDTRVIPARLFGHKKTGGRVELLLERILTPTTFLAQVRASKSLKPGDDVFFQAGICFRVLGKSEQFYELALQEAEESVLQIFEKYGEIPLPPYMHRSPDEQDKLRYQTIYAKYDGSVAAPTAGLHFDAALMTALAEKQIQTAYLTLHVGAGTFAPIRVTQLHEHQMHAEYFEVSQALCDQIAATHAAGKRVIAVGTTTLRALESAAETGKLQSFQGETRIFMYPGHRFRSVDALITNFHLPQSTLLMLVCAFGGCEPVMQAYREAVAQNYRFYSYGDAMLVELNNK